MSLDAILALIKDVSEPDLRLISSYLILKGKVLNEIGSFELARAPLNEGLSILLDVLRDLI